MVRILNIEPQDYSREARNVLCRLGELVEADLTREELLRRLSGYDVLIVRLVHQVDREVIDAGSKLRVIVSATTGLDHIDVPYAVAKGVQVLSLKGETEFLEDIHATAEHTWALLLALVRIPQAFNSVRSGQWERDRYRGRELNGKRLGIIGLGRVGRKTARFAAAFGMPATAYDPYTKDWPKMVERRFTLADLLTQSDIVSVHLPLNEQTAKMIGQRELALMPRHAILINTARGELVDDQALVECLESGHLAGAALDVILDERNEEKRRNSRLIAYAREHENLVITPHLGGATEESMAKTEVFMAHRLARALSMA